MNKRKHNAVGAAEIRRTPFSPHSADPNSPTPICTDNRTCPSQQLPHESRHTLSPLRRRRKSVCGLRPAHLNSHHQCVVLWCDRDNRVRSSLRSYWVPFLLSFPWSALISLTSGSVNVTPLEIASKACLLYLFFWLFRIRWGGGDALVKDVLRFKLVDPCRACS